MSNEDRAETTEERIKIHTTSAEMFARRYSQTGSTTDLQNMKYHIAQAKYFTAILSSKTGKMPLWMGSR